MHLTPKQLELIRVIAEANPDGSPTDLDEIIERVDYKPSKASIHFSIRALVAHELIEKVGTEKRRGRIRVLIAPTTLGKHFAAATRSAPSFTTSIMEAEVLSELEAI